MLKKSLMAASLLAISTGLAFANGGTVVPQKEHITHDFYVGAAVSRDFLSFSETQSNYYHSSTAAPFSLFFTRKADHGDDGWAGQLFMGTGFTFNNHYYLGLEAFGSGSNADVNFSLTSVTMYDGTVTQKLKRELKYSYGLSVLPGVKIADNLLVYTRVGWIRSKFDGKVTISSSATGSSSRNLKAWDTSQNGLQLGLGLRGNLSQKITMRLEYDWDNYGSNISNTALSPSGKTKAVHKTSDLTVNQISLGLGYHFMAA